MSNGLVTQADAMSMRTSFKDRAASISKLVFNGERNASVIALLATLVAATIVVILWTSAKNYVPLYGNQEHYDKASILEVLENEQVPFRIDSDTGSILVPTNRLADARITLSARGIKAAMPEGLANINEKISVGTSQFMESRQYQHALEGELARTIIAMDGVRNSRVHLAVPKRSLFVGRAEERPAASVMVDLVPGYDLELTQVEAIVSLVSGSIPGLEPQHVSVVDQTGKLMTGQLYDKSPIGKQSDKKLAFKETVERNIQQRASAMLSPILGHGNFRIQVSSVVDFSVVEETKEAIDPESVVRQETLKSDATLDKMAMGIPGSLANRPPVSGESAPDPQNQLTNESTESIRQFENGRSVTHTRYEVGRLESMSVSVLVNEAVAANGTWTEEELNKVAGMVKAATGFQSERGDQFNIASFQFRPEDPLSATEGLPWWQMPEVLEYSRYLIGTLLSFLLLFFGVRPLVKHLVGNNKERHQIEATDSAASGENSVEQSKETPVAHVPSEEELLADVLSGQSIPSPERSENVVVREFDGLPQVGSEFSEQIAHMQLLADKESVRVAAVIKSWIKQGVEVESANI